MLTPKIDPKKIFASQAPSQDVPAEFNNYERGWDESRKNNGKPTIKQFNKLQQLTDEKILWIHQNGAALPFDETMEYAEGAVVLKDGVIQYKTASGFKSRDAVTIPTYNSAADGVDPVTGVSDGAYYNVRSSSDESYIDEYQNVGGVATATGKSYPSSAALKEVDDKTTQLLSPFTTMERLGGSTSDSGEKNVLALREYFRGAAAGEYGTLLLGRGTYKLNDSVVATSPVSIKGVGTSVNGAGVYSAFSDNRSVGTDPLISFINGDLTTVGLNLSGFEVVGNSRIAKGMYFDIVGWVTHISDVVVRHFKMNGVIFEKTNDALISDLRIITCGGKHDGVVYYSLDMNPSLLTSGGGSNQLNFVRLHIEVTRYFMRMRNWLCNFYGGHFEVGAASQVFDSGDWQSPMFDVGPVNYQNNFFGCNFVYPSIWLLYRTNNKVGGEAFFENSAPVFGSTLSGIDMLNPASTNVMYFSGCSFIPNGGTGSNADNRYMYGHKLFDLPYAQVRISGGSIERLISNNFGGHIVATRPISITNTPIHAHFVAQAVIDGDPENATLLTHFRTTNMQKFIRLVANSAQKSTIIGNTFHNFTTNQLIDDQSPASVYSSPDFIVASNSGITNKFSVPSTINTTSQTFRNGNLMFNMAFTGGVSSQVLGDDSKNTYFITKTTDAANKVTQYISVQATGNYIDVGDGGTRTYPVTDNTGSVGTRQNRYNSVHAVSPHYYPPTTNNPTANGEVTLELTSNTELKFKVKGHDGVTRTAILTLA